MRKFRSFDPGFASVFNPFLHSVDNMEDIRVALGYPENYLDYTGELSVKEGMFEDAVISDDRIVGFLEKGDWSNLL